MQYINALTACAYRKNKQLLALHFGIIANHKEDFYMKLKQKLAMVLAATTIATTIPVTTSAINLAVNKESMTTQVKDNYNKYWYIKLEDYQVKNEASNLIIYNNNNDILYGARSPLFFEIIGTDIEFASTYYTETKGNDAFNEEVDLEDYTLVEDDTIQIPSNAVFAVEDISADNDGSYVAEMGGLPNRLFAIDEDGNYTSYVSTSYASKKRYLNNAATNATYAENKTTSIDEAYFFAEAKNNDGVPIYINLTENGGQLSPNFTSIKDVNPQEITHIIKPNEGNINTGSFNTAFSFVDPATSNPLNGQLYLKEFTISPDRYNDQTLAVEIYQNMNRNLDSRVYVPMAFTVTGKSPSIKVDGDEIFANKLTLSSNSEVSGDLIDINLNSKGQVAVDGSGKLGVFELEEKQEYVFSGEFFATGKDWEGDFYLDPDDDTDGGTTGGGAFLLQLQAKNLEFALDEGDRYWDEWEIDESNKVTSEPGTLQNHIQLSGGLRGKEDYVQIEVLAVEENEMLIRVIDTTDTYSQRNYEGAIEFHNLPVEIASRHDELDLGDIELTVTQVEDIEYKNKGGDIGLFDYDDANEAEEEFVIAKVVDEDVTFEVLDDVDLVAGQDSGTIEIRLGELIAGSIDSRDEFFISFINADIVSGSLENVEFHFDSGDLANDPDNILYEDDGEYILDLDAMYDELEKIGFLSGSNDQKEDDWHDILSELEFELEIEAQAGVSGTMQMVIESDNFKEEEISFAIGTVSPSFRVSAPPVLINLGVKDQSTGKITFTETDEEMFKDGTEIILAIEDLGSSNKTFDDADVYTDKNSGLDVDANFEDGLLVLEITDESDDGPGTITIENIVFDIWAGTPRGGYDLYIGGNAVEFSNSTYDQLYDDNDKDEDDIFDAFVDESDITVADYLTVGAEATEPETPKVVTVVDFRSGTTTVNGQRVSMTSRPYITPAGWSMIGVRDIATFFGIDEQQIAYGHDENNVMNVTITNGPIGAPGSTLVTVKHGSKILMVNGTPVIMGEPMTIGSDNRAYAPIRPIAEALGLTVDWNNATSTATFQN